MASKLMEQTVLVDGDQRSALYDLTNNRITRVPREVALQIRAGTDIEGKWSQYLTRHGFLRDAPDAWLAYASDYVYPLRAPMHTLMLSGGLAGHRHLLEWIREGSHHTDGCHLVVLAAQEATRTSMGLLERIGAIANAASYELLVHHPNGNMTGEVFDRNLEIVFRREGIAQVSRPQGFIRADVVTYSTLRTQSELSGVLFADEHGVLWPHPHEKTWSFGSLADPLSTVVESIPYRAAQRNTKDRRDRCSGCEIRYACGNPFAYRQGAAITSEPSNCMYQPASPDPQNHLFSGAVA